MPWQVVEVLNDILYDVCVPPQGSQTIARMGDIVMQIDDTKI